MLGAAPWEQYRVPCTLTRIMRSICSGVICSKGRWSTRPALFTRQYTGPKAFTMSAKQASTASRSVMSST